MTKKESEMILDNKSERKLVVPGETIIKGDNYLPGDFTRKEGEEIVANRYGYVEISGRVVKIIPISGVFEPRRGNTVIGRVEDITFNGWIMDIGAPYSSFLPLTECPRYIDRNNIAEFADIGDVMTVKIVCVKKGGIDLTLKSRGLGKLNEGRIIRINPHKVPRVIGKEGSMINLIKGKTNTEIIVGQNGFIWIKGDIEGEKKAEETIKLIADEAGTCGLTDKIEKFLNGGKK
ncbi:MAG: exosome complex RNA-binding protein Rrp4 [Candidatus Pacearchaeota archaeon]